MRVVNVELQYEEDKMKGDITETLKGLLDKEGIEVISVDRNKNTEPESPYQRVKNKEVASDVSSAGAGGMVSPN
ncbi:hypothetical protein AC623_13825 [Bacillus sp. FJAT-27231]|uniref:hypothetical protein n=1 Tax=Bacillus sp. FJAT-27231 TaxID=1679168 RepID=UPI0006715067|nr:hypothetical protein [Bacillus sp. FJAT-27231]KMY54879.1 hypothetical protein AC623_13825 [Bacillus sp. FJAT-27231]